SVKPILGSGPYLLEKINAGQRVIYKRNPKYWARDLKVNQGRYNFNRVGYVYYRSKDIAFTAFKAGLYTLHEEESARQ
ncbi:ABC transporter substrate-binding protein, partial [Klebsiella sp. K47]